MLGIKNNFQNARVTSVETSSLKTENKLRSCARHGLGYLIMKIRITSYLTILCLMFGLQSCDSSKPIIESGNLDFKAVNLSASVNGQVDANGYGTVITTTVNLTLTINGETTTVSVTCKSNELPVQVGDEIEITFYPSCPEESEAFISLPDGTNRKVTATSPSFKWTVPDNFTDGMEITGTSHYETDDAKYKESGLIRLIAIDNCHLKN